MDQNALNGIIRGEPEATEQRKALVERVISEVQKDEKKWAPAFKRMRSDMRFVRRQLPEEVEDDTRIKVNVIQRHVNQRVATLYAKNPTFVAQRRKQLDFEVWDGKRATLEAAAQVMQASGGMAPPETAALLMDVQNGIARQTMTERVGMTLEILLGHAVDEQQPPFKQQAKQTVRRSIICGISYAKLGFQRTLTKRPDTEAKLADITDRLAAIERLRADIADGEVDPYSAEVEELRLSEEALKAEQDIVVREGLVFDFPRSTNIIPDRSCTQLTIGFPGAKRVSERFLMNVDEIKETYGVDIGSAYKGYSLDQTKGYTTCDDDSKQAMVFEVYDKKAGLLYVVCDGYHDFLQDPAPPPLSYLEPFFPFFPLTFNPIEEEEEIFPESDVRLLRATQVEINRKREAVRQHRIANRPLNVVRKGLLDEEDAKDLSTHPAHAVIELSLGENEDVEKAFKPFPKPGVDPNLYETGTDLTDIQLIVGAQEANLGGTSGDSATENSIAEQSRLTSIASCVDDLDDWLSALARCAGQALLLEYAEETAKRVAGPGAVWPVLDKQTIAEEVYLEIEAGSSGRPNQAQEIAKLERLTPLLVQLPGVNPEWLARMSIKTLDPRVNLEEAFTYGLPSITAMNRLSQVGTGDPATDPGQQGDQGGQNSPNDDTSKGGAQPSYQTDANNGAPAAA